MVRISATTWNRCLICSKICKGVFCKAHQRYSHDKDDAILSLLESDRYANRSDTEMSIAFKIPLDRLRELKIKNNIPLKLSAKEKEVLRLWTKKMSTKKISKKMGMSRFSIYKIIKSLGLETWHE